MKCLFALLMMFSGCAEARPAPIEQYTYRIEFPSGSLCSATAVAKDVILTARHCVEGDEKSLVIAGQTVRVLGIKTDSLDHARIRVSRRFAVWAKFGPSAKVGDQIQFFGNAEGLHQVYRQGYVAAYLGPYMYTDVMVGKGDSGAGLFNRDGELVGVISAVHIGQLVKFGVSLPLSTEMKED